MAETKRIIELNPTDVISSDDQLAVDSPTLGSRKISWPDLLDLIIAEAEAAEAGAIAAAAAAAASATASAGSATASAGSATASAGSATAAGTSEANALTYKNAALASQNAAAGSAVAAANSATTALNAIAQAYKGGVAGGAVANTSTLSGDTYRITSAGTSQGKTWGIGDAAIYEGTSGNWTQLAGYFSGQQSLVDSGVARTLEGAGLLCNGTNKAQVSESTALNITGSDFYIGQWFRASSLALPSMTLKKGGDADYQLGDYSLQVNPSGQVAFYANGTNPVALESATGLFVVNRWGFIEVTRSGNDFTLWLNGTQIATSAAPTYVPNNTTYPLYVGGFLGGTNPFITNGNIARTVLGNFAPSADERAALFARLGLVPREWWGGGGVVYMSDFSVDSNGWTSDGDGFGGTVVGNIDTNADGSGVPPSNDWMRVKKVAATGSLYAYTLSQTTISRSYRTTYSVYIPASNTTQVTHLSFGAITASLGIGRIITAVNPGPNTITVEHLAQDSALIFTSCDASGNNRNHAVGDAFYFKQITVTQRGATYIQGDADQGAGPVLRAPTGSDTLLPGDGHETGGVVRGNPATGAAEIGPFDFGSAPLHLLGGLDVRRVPAGYVVTGIRIKAEAGSTGNVFIGSDAGTTSILSSYWNALTVGDKNYSLASGAYVSPDRVWIAGDGTVAAGSKVWLMISPN